jgi:hypothetical protein
MNKTMAFFLGLAAGAVAGFFGGKAYRKAEHQTRLNEEIAYVREAYNRTFPPSYMDTAAPETPVAPPFRDISSVPSPTVPKRREPVKLPVDYASFGRREPEEHHEEAGVEDDGADDEDPERCRPPFLISSDEFGDQAGFETVLYTYYADGVLTDYHDQPLTQDDIERAIGPEALNEFKNGNTDTVYVRNESLRNDYEIGLDNDRYEDVIREKPWLFAPMAVDVLEDAFVDPDGVTETILNKVKVEDLGNLGKEFMKVVNNKMDKQIEDL